MTIGSVTHSHSAALQAAASEAARGFAKAPEATVREIEATAARLVSEAAAANVAATSTGHVLPEGAPELRSPDLALAHAFLEGGEQAARSMTPEALLMALVGELMATIQAADAESMKARAEVYKESMATMKASYEALMSSAEEAQTRLDADTQAAIEAGEEAQRKLTLATTGAERVDRLQAQLDALPPDDPQRAQLETELQAAKTELEALRKDAVKAETEFLKATDKVTESQKALNLVLEQAEELQKTVLPGIGFQQFRPTNNAQLTQLMAVLSTVISTSQAKKHEADYKLAMEQLQAQEAANKHRAEEHAKQLEKANQTNAITKCIVGILAVFVAAVFVALTPLLGPVSGIVSGLMLALAVVSLATGFDPIGAVVQKFMEHVLKPIADAVGKLATKLLIKAGMDPKEAEKVGKIFGYVFAAVAVVVVIVASVVIAKNSGIAAKVGEMFGKAASKMAPGLTKALTQASARMTAAGTNAVGAQAMAMATVLPTVHAGVSLGVQVGASGARISASVDQLKAAEFLAELEVALKESDFIRDRVSQFADEYAESSRFVQDLLEKMSDINQRAHQTSTSIVARMAHTA